MALFAVRAYCRYVQRPDGQLLTCSWRHACAGSGKVRVVRPRQVHAEEAVFSEMGNRMNEYLIDRRCTAYYFRLIVIRK